MKEQDKMRSKSNPTGSKKIVAAAGGADPALGASEAHGLDVGKEEPGGCAEQAAEAKIHKAIVEAVLSHKLPPGTRLVEIPLCRAFGVTRTQLRRVLVRLSNEKMVELHHNRGAMIVQPSALEMREVFVARRLIESGIVRELAANIDAHRLEPMWLLLEQERKAYADGAWSQAIRLSGEFHLQLAELMGNGELVSILRGLVARTTLMIALYDTPGRSVCSFDEHIDILKRLTAGDVEGSCAHMSHHLLSAETNLARPAPEAAINLEQIFDGFQ